MILVYVNSNIYKRENPQQPLYKNHIKVPQQSPPLPRNPRLPNNILLINNIISKMHSSRNASMLNIQQNLIPNHKRILHLLPIPRFRPNFLNKPARLIRLHPPQNPMFLRHPHNTPLRSINDNPKPGELTRLLRKRNGPRVDERLVALRVHATHISENAHSLLRRFHK